ncbi:CocE/NonD family hydrolase [Kouleothrix sp.]|uniref:CocE/NonD family hydrolase n=1 Tax=Kouleothrix sp. TaxID=2779161 RepID=UPI00391A269B
MSHRRTVLAAAGLALASPGVRRWLWARLLGLPPARYGVRASRDIAVPMPDGARLMTDHYAPSAPGAFPTILIRTPYGKWTEAGLFGLVWGAFSRLLAARGYHVVIQLTRGRYTSGGTFDPLADEAADGMATLEWLKAQPWFNGSLGTWGASYLGYVQWAIAADAQPLLKAMVPIVTGAQLGSLTHPDGAFGLDTLLAWTAITELQGGDTRRSPSWRESIAGPDAAQRLVEQAFQHLPLAEADQRALGRTVTFYQDWLQHTDLRGPYWQQRDHTAHVADVAAPAHFISGWYDLIQRELLADYEALRRAGRAPYLTIGPWAHTSPQLVLASLREGLRWFDWHMKGAAPPARRPVRLFFIGANVWREFGSWPPPARTTAWFLQGEAGLAPTQPGIAAPDHYRYDPADPTPALGGARLVGPLGGPRDQRPIEARPDILCYTSAPLDRDLDIAGPVRLVLFVRSSLEHTDFLGRLCDVHPDGRSINLCDGLLRLTPGAGERQPDGSLRIEIGLWNIAARFRRGHCIRLHVASGAHPRWSRNLGYGDPLADATRARAADQTVYHDAAHPSALLLPTIA